MPTMAVASCDDWFSICSQLAARGCSVQVVFEVRSLCGHAPLAQIDDLMPTTALALRLVHRNVRVLQEVRGHFVGLLPHPWVGALTGL